MKSLPCIEPGCKARIKGPFYCKDHEEKITEFTIGNRSKIVVDRLMRRLRRRKPSWLILDDKKMYVDSVGWVASEDEEGKLTIREGHIKNILFERGYTHVKD